MKFLKKFLKNTENVRTIYTCGFKGFYEFKECSKGITLIALVITIIVMLILVGVTLNMISGDNGILGKAERAVDITNESAIKEEVEMAIAENMMGYYGDGVSEGKDFFKYMSEKLTGYETPSGATLGCEEDGSITYTDKKGNTVFFQMDEEGRIEFAGKVMAGEEIQDTVAPKVKVNSTTINSITFTATDGVGVEAYAITDDENEPNEWTDIEKSKKYTTTVSGKIPNQTYYVWAKDRSNVSIPAKAVTVPAYSVTYDANGGNGIPTDDTLYEKNAEITVDFSTTPTRTSYTFLGWTDDASNKNTAKYTLAGTKTFAIGEANVTLYAVWQAILVEEISLDQKNIELIKSNNSSVNVLTNTLTATVTNSDATDKKINWTSSDENVATVNQNGVVTAVGAGSCTITAGANDASGKSDTSTVNVKERKYIYYYGNKFQNITGGWTAYSNQSGDWWRYNSSLFSAESGNCIKVNGKSNSYAWYCAGKTVNTISTEDYNSLVMQVKVYLHDESWQGNAVSYGFANVATASGTNTNGNILTKEWNISTLHNTLGYIYISNYCAHTAQPYSGYDSNSYIYLYNAYLEK